MIGKQIALAVTAIYSSNDMEIWIFTYEMKLK